MARTKKATGLTSDKVTAKQTLSETIDFDVRFSEVDSMNIVWHGSYPLYFEDAREAFGRKYDLGYLTMFKLGVYAPLVDLRFQYHKPLSYGMRPKIKATYRPTDAAKIIFDYEIFNPEDGTIFATGYSIQVFLDHDYNLVYYNPPFYEAWKKKWLDGETDENTELLMLNTLKA